MTYFPVTSVQFTDDMVELKLNPSESPSFLGDARTDSRAVNKIPPESHYGRVPRPAIQDLPGFHSADRKFWGTSSEAKAAELASKKIYGGNFTLSAKRATDNKPDTSVTYYTISAVVSGGQFEGPLIGISFHHKLGEVPESLAYVVPSKDGKTLMKLLQENQEVAIFSRLIHLFLRTLGAWVGPTVFYFLVDNLETTYAENLWRKEYLDLAVIRADVAFNNHTNSSSDPILPCDCDGKGRRPRVSFMLTRVGEAMEALQKTEAASNLYLETLQDYWKSDDPLVLKADLLHKAAIALGHAHKYKEAETLILRAVTAEISNLNHPWEKAREEIVDYAAVFYLLWISMEPKAWEKESQLFAVALMSLFVIAEANLQKKLRDVLTSAAGQNPNATDPVAAARFFLKSKFATKKTAQKALSAAFSNPENTGKFRADILKCCTKKDFSFEETFGISSDPKYSEELKRDYRKGHKEFAKAFLADNRGGENSSAAPCEYTYCGAVLDVDKLLRCPCHTVLYCGKSCQRADWKTHKKICPWKLNQKAKKGI